MDVVVTRRVTPIVTSRLVLEPVTRQLALAVVAGRLSDVRAGAGWPHADTAAAMSMALSPDAGPSWVVTIDGVVIGDCGGLSWPDDGGAVEIGYGLAPLSRGHGYAIEAVEAMCRWLFVAAGASVITATDVDVDNLASRRVLERVGFEQTDEDDLHASFRLKPVPESHRGR